ncbi:hypothetical protein ACFYPA_06190 [Streptomyces sp. NPDC005775]|uniref:hypothetical protein n=1 Tax=Streptomyces sp. NPDC005775 TaxID=3364729 RepID=UPI0036A72423
MSDTPMTPDHNPICTQEAARAAGLDVAPSPEELRVVSEAIVSLWGDRWAEPDDTVASIADSGAQLARAVPLVLAEVDRLRAQVAELETQRTSVLALHQQHTDSAHCMIDGDWWPCSTRNALRADVEYGLLLPGQDDDHPAVIVGTTYDRAEAEQGIKDWPDAGHVLMARAPGGNKWAPVDEAAELAEGQAQLDAMRADHPAPCRVPDSPDCTCPAEEGRR